MVALHGVVKTGRDVRLKGDAGMLAANSCTDNRFKGINDKINRTENRLGFAGEWANGVCSGFLYATE
ncbi:hypothetical protein DUU53_25440 [Salmonella enterica subsp. enterica serovar Berlin]|nr:hypothetical protein [Salmonella enterica subsp. enterica serovar Berlin]